MKFIGMHRAFKTNLKSDERSLTRQMKSLHASSGCQFYITQGRGPLTNNDIKLYEYRINKKLRTHLKDSVLQRAEYKATLEKY
ncbi:MAG TPA: hypothetical protein VF411_12055 [Bacteroidia bacterium]